MTVADAEHLCQRAGLAPVRITLEGHTVRIEVLPFAVTVETAIKRLYAAGAYQVSHGHMYGQEYFRIREKRA